MDNTVSHLRISKETPVKFSYRNPNARCVFLAGDFNHWNPQNLPMVRHGDGSWHVDVSLRPGRHQYRFVADGTWVDDPAAKDRIINHLGGHNCVCIVQ